MAEEHGVTQITQTVVRGTRQRMMWRWEVCVILSVRAEQFLAGMVSVLVFDVSCCRWLGSINNISPRLSTRWVAMVTRVRGWMSCVKYGQPLPGLCVGEEGSMQLNSQLTSIRYNTRFKRLWWHKQMIQMWLCRPGSKRARLWAFFETFQLIASSNLQMALISPVFTMDEVEAKAARQGTRGNYAQGFGQR